MDSPEGVGMLESNSGPQGDGSTPPDTTSGPNQFSCVNCRRRKVKCNKIHPCTPCAKGRMTCVFPPPRRLTRGDGNPNPALLSKINHLENIIESLRLTIAQKDAQISEKQQPRDQQAQADEHEIVPLVQLGSPVSSEPSETDVASAEGRILQQDIISETHFSPNFSQQATSCSSGRLIKDEGRSIYIRGTFWTALEPYEAEDWRDLDDSLEDDDNISSAPSSMSTPLTDFPLRISGNSQMNPHPTVANRQKLWRVFSESIDPILKVLHIPTMGPTVNEWLQRDDMSNIPKNLNAFLFVVYFSAVSSLDNDVCRGLLGAERDELVAQYRAAEENALAMASLLKTDDLLVMQSFIIYLATLRHHSPRLSWTLCSLGFRLLQSLGAHRDGASLSRSVFDSEMHRRLFWVLCLLECGAAEDCGCDPTMFEVSSVDTSLPRNVNDRDLSVSMMSEPEEHPCWTESTLLVLWAEICQLWRLAFDSRRHPEGMSKSMNEMTHDEKKEFVKNYAHRIDEQYVKICSPLIPIQWVTATMGRLLILEYKIMICKPIERHTELSQEDRDEFFSVSIECIELSNKLLTDRRGVRWAWLFKTFAVWHPLAYALTELASRPLQKEYERAWSVVEQAMVSRWHSPHHRLGHQWRSMINLLGIAQAAKTRELRRRRESMSSRADTSVASGRYSSRNKSLGKVKLPWKSNSYHQTSPHRREATCTSSVQGQPPSRGDDGMQFGDIPNISDLSSFHLPSENISNELESLPDFSELDFPEEAIHINSPDTTFIQALLQEQESFTMELG